MDAIRIANVRKGFQRLLQALLLLVITGSASAQMQPPRYPAESAAAGETGTVILILDVAADGSVTKVEVETSSGFPRLDASAMEAAAGWRFTPPTVAGKPVGGRVRVPVDFAPK
ncbi:energy transducer TonB [Stenotrophomonas sp. PS02289]|uniref:energy transducer TonB n=1 Tax=Stenotrophomonas sp. PS02289 TaxID=2991422 RepID=UPI00249A42DB|nr:energy transducer TonB [Stenotrophomonas sp. PS02289]